MFAAAFLDRLARRIRGLLRILDAADVDEDERRHRDARHHIHQHDIAPTEDRQQRADRKRRKRIADVAAHAVERHHQPLPFGKAVGEPRDRGRMPEVVADADEGRAQQHHPIDVREAHHEIGEADPEQRHRHQQALAADRVDEDAAGNVGDGARRILERQDRADLAVAQPQLGADQRQQQIERRRIPMGERVTRADNPDLPKRTARLNARIDRRHRHFEVHRPCPRQIALPVKAAGIGSGGLAVCTVWETAEQSP